jgi:hypothetical protein
MYDTFTREVVGTERKKLQCNECRRETIHMLEARCTGLWSFYHPVGETVDGGTHFSLYRCGACDTVCFEKDSWDSEATDWDDNGHSYPTHDLAQFPPPSSADFSFDTSFIPERLVSLIDEMMYSLAGGKLILATIGLRLVVEEIVNDKKIKGKDLLKKIDGLSDDGHIDEDQRALLHTIRKKGNKGAHEAIAMTKKEMVAGMSIVGLLLERLYNGPARHADAILKAQRAFKEEGSDLPFA